MMGKFFILEECEQGWANKCKGQAEELLEARITGCIASFYPHLSLETVSQALKITFYAHTMPERVTPQVDKIRKQGNRGICNQAVSWDSCFNKDPWYTRGVLVSPNF